MIIVAVAENVLEQWSQGGFFDRLFGFKIVQF